MDKTMELVLVSLILMVTGVIIISMANEQITGFGESIGDKNDEAEEDLGDELDDISHNNPSEKPESLNLVREYEISQSLGIYLEKSSNRVSSV